MFDGAFKFKDELALVTVNEKCGYIDKKGNWVLQPTMYEQLVISISNILKDYWDFPSEINNALYEFFQEEIFPRKSL